MGTQEVVAKKNNEANNPIIGFFIKTKKGDPKRELLLPWVGLDFNKNRSVFSIATD